MCQNLSSNLLYMLYICNKICSNKIIWLKRTKTSWCSAVWLSTPFERKWIGPDFNTLRFVHISKVVNLTKTIKSNFKHFSHCIATIVNILIFISVKQLSICKSMLMSNFLQTVFQRTKYIKCIFTSTVKYESLSKWEFVCMSNHVIYVE